MGSICGFVGPNGSGKTTTIRMLLGLITPTTGSGHVLGESITEPEKYLPQVGAMIEGPAFYPALTGFQNLNVLAKIGGFSTEALAALLDLVGLGDRGDSKYKTYSLGMKQRLGIAAALLPNPKLLVLDEPTNGLDPAGIHEIRTLLRKLADSGTTVFVSSHLLSEIEMISDHLVMLRLGKVIFSGKTSDLLAKQQPVIVAKPEKVSDLSKLAQIAISAGHEAKILDNAVHVTGTSDFSAKLNKAAFEAGITLESLTPVKPSLEETFFEMTGE
jgi:ABC-2 type transport system ATP-binding protein